MKTSKIKNILAQVDREKDVVKKLALLSTLKSEVDVLMKGLAKQLL